MNSLSESELAQSPFQLFLTSNQDTLIRTDSGEEYLLSHTLYKSFIQRFDVNSADAPYEEVHQFRTFVVNAWSMIAVELHRRRL